MMKNDTVTPEAAKAVLIAKLAKQSAHIADLIRWGSWTIAAEICDSIAADARAVRALELLPQEPSEKQWEFDAFNTSRVSTQLPIFSPAVSHHSAARDLPAPPAKAAGSVVFGGRR